VKESENGDLSDFERGQNRARVCNIMSSYTDCRKTNISEEEQWARINIGRKRLSYIEKDFFKKSQNYCSIGDSRTV
jgi:hypothetical protein